MLTLYREENDFNVLIGEGIQAWYGRTNTMTATFKDRAFERIRSVIDPELGIDTVNRVTIYDGIKPIAASLTEW